MNVVRIERDDEETGSRELVQAQEALLELLASTLDSTLVMVTDSHRGARLEDICLACDRIGFLGQAVKRIAA